LYCNPLLDTFVLLTKLKAWCWT